jgi:hypothetical protein
MSAIDQYCEAIPAPGGDRGNTDPDRGGRVIPAAARRALERSGPDGRAIVGLSAASKLEAGGNDHGDGLTGVPAAPVRDRPADAPGANPIAALASGVTDGETVGPFLGTLMLFLALAFFSTAWLRYRRRAQS